MSEFTCPLCQESFRAAATLGGRRTVCSNCQEVVRLSDPDAPRTPTQVGTADTPAGTSVSAPPWAAPLVKPDEASRSQGIAADRWRRRQLRIRRWKKNFVVALVASALLVMAVALLLQF